MNIALSILSAAAATGEAASEAAQAVTEKWGITFGGIEEAVEEASGSSGGVIDRLLSYNTAPEQLADKDYWGSVGITALSGILVVFLILAILIFIFWLMGVVFQGINKSAKTKAEAAAKAQAAKSEPAVAAAAPAEAEEAAEEDDDEIIAVISAAIAAYSEQDGTTYAIRKIERKDGRTRSAWSLAGIGENTRPF